MNIYLIINYNEIILNKFNLLLIMLLKFFKMLILIVIFEVKISLLYQSNDNITYTYIK